MSNLINHRFPPKKISNNLKNKGVKQLNQIKKKMKVNKLHKKKN